MSGSHTKNVDIFVNSDFTWGEIQISSFYFFLDIDLSALNELPDALLTSQATSLASSNLAANLGESAPQQSYLSGLLTSSTSNNVTLSNGMVPPSYQSVSVGHSTAPSMYSTQQQQIPQQAHSLSTLQQLNSTTTVVNQQQPTVAQVCCLQEW